MTRKFCRTFVLNSFIMLLLTSKLANGIMDQGTNRKLMEEKLTRKGISQDAISRMTAGDRTVFKTMSNQEFQKLTPDLIANAGKQAIENLDVSKVKMMTKTMYQGNEKNLETIFKSLNADQIRGVLDAFEEMYKNTSERQHLNCVQFEPLMGALKRTFGEPSAWSKDVFNKLGSDFVQCLPPSDLKNVAGNKDVFRSLLENVKYSREKHKPVSNVEKRNLLESATEAFGQIKDWKLADLKSASSLVVTLKPKDLKQLDTAVLRDAIEDLGKEDWEEKRGKELVTKLKDPANGFGAINTWTAETVERLGNLRGSLSKKELAEISTETLQKSVRAFGRTPLPSYKKRALGQRLKTIYGGLKNWTSEHIQNVSDLLGGLEAKDLENIGGDALLEALPTVKDIELPRHKGRVLAKKIQSKIGNVQHWNLTVMKQIGPLVKDLPDTMLTQLKPDEAREAVKMLRERKDVPMSKKRVLIKQALKAGGSTSRLSVKEFGELVSEFPLTELKKVTSVDDLLPGESNGNESMEAEASWKPSQARALLKDIIISDSNWGPVAQDNDNWTIGNIKKLRRLALGLDKTDLANLDSTSFLDFAAEFSQISNWTVGQAYEGKHQTLKSKLERDVDVKRVEAKKISSIFMESFKDRESEITVTEITSLGDFVINILDNLLERLSLETAADAVRTMGASRVYGRLPKALKQRKTKTALKILNKDVLSLSSDDLEDLGRLVSGFEKQDVAQLDSSAFSDAMVTMGDVQDLDEEITKALATKAVEAFGGTSSFTGEILHDLGKIVEGLDSNDIAGIPVRVVDENLHVFAEATLDASAAQAVMAKVESAARKRRSADMSSMTGDDLIEMGSAIVAFTKNQIASVTNDAFSSAVAEISIIKGFTSEQLQAWASKAKSAWGTPDSFTDDEVLQLNEFAKGFTASELKVMPISSNEVLESLGSVSGYTTDQIAKLWENVKTGKTVTTMTSDDFKSLGVIALSLSGTEISQITTATYQDAALELGQTDGWSSDQTKALKTKAIAAFGAVSSWSPAEMSLAGAAIGGFTATEIQNINADQLDAIEPTALKYILPEIFKEFTVEQISQLNAEQAASITTEQRDALSSEQRNTLLKVETDTLELSSGFHRIARSFCVLVFVLILQLLSWF